MDLINGKVETISQTAPTARVRIGHKYTNKQWQHETTVELTFDVDGNGGMGITERLLEEADAKGRAENARRTALDAAESEVV